MARESICEGKEKGMKYLLRTSLFTVFFALSAVCCAQHGPDVGSPLHMLAAVKAELNLNTSQQLQWDNAVALAKTAHEAARAARNQLKAAMQAELAKAEPDLASVAMLGDGMRPQAESAHRAVRDAWFSLYATFTPEQKVVVRETLKAAIARMQDRHGRRGVPATAN
jgi:hypothetical protein